MARRVAIIGTGMTIVGISKEPSWMLFADAALEAVREAGVELSDIQGLHFGNVGSTHIENQHNLAPLVLSVLGIETNIPCAKYEVACTSGSIAFRQGYLNILSGLYDIQLVGGAEILKSVHGSVVQQVFARGMSESERNSGLTFASYFSYLAKAYARKYGLGIDRLQELLAAISVKNRYHGSFNQLVQFRDRITVDDVRNSTVVAPPIRLLDCCPFSDGAAALILASEDVARNCKNPVWIEGSGQSSGKFHVLETADPTDNPAYEKAVKDAYEQAKMGPGDIDIAEVHDCTNIHEVMCLESAGLFKRGEGIYSAAEGKTYFDGEIPVNLSGGLETRGHPVGATGAYQLCEISRVLRGDWKGKHPKGNPEIGLTFNVGGTGTAVTAHILRKG